MRPSRALGQHFLTDITYVNRILTAAQLTHDDVVVEVGPGMGVLTQRLAAAASLVIALELDERLALRLQQELHEQANLTVVKGDALTVQPAELLTAAGLSEESPYCVVGNLPYNAGTAIVRRFLESTHPPVRLLVMLQREVAEAMAAPEGNTGLLGVSVQVYATPRKLFNVPPRAFYPQPRVTSSVIELRMRPQPLVTPDQTDSFFRIVRAGFSAPRKQLRNTLAQGMSLPPAIVAQAIALEGLDPTLRPQQLTIDDWLRLSRRLEASA